MRHLIWTVALVATLALPAVSGWLPAITVIVPQSLATVIDAPTSMTDGQGRAVTTDRTALPQSVASRDGAEATLVEAGEPQAGLTTSLPVRSAMPPLDWPTALFLLWSAGAVFVLLRFAVGLGTAWWMSRAATTIEDPSWRHLAHDLSDRLGPRPVRPAAS